MRFSGSLAALLLLPILGSALESDVVDLTEGTFKAEVMGENLALVEFFAPWCGHCKNLAPHYEEAATELKLKEIKLAKVDCTAEQAVCSEHGVNSYPTLKVFRNGVPTDYAGPRKADGIISYMIKQSLPAVSDVTSESHAEFIKSDKVVLVAYGDDSHPVPQAFIDYANTARDSYLFGQYTGSPLPDIPESPALPAVVLYKSFDEGFAVVPDNEVSELTDSFLAGFIKENSVPLFDEISPENFGTYAEMGLPIAYLFAEPEASDARKQLIEQLTSLVKELKGKVNFVYIDAIKFADHGKSLALSDEWPAFVIQDLAQQTKYPMTGSVDKSTVTEFARKFISGELSPAIRSQPIPETQDAPVLQLVADDWDNVFGDEEKDVFAEFFAPWCGHCQRLAPIWETLGEKYAESKNIVIAQMDATENDIPPQAPFRVGGFPTLKFRPAGSSEFVDYTGDRSLESLIEFVETNKRSEGANVDMAEKDEVEVEDEAEDEDEAPEHDEL